MACLLIVPFVDCTLFRMYVEYGTVLELRINSGGKLPNFGFVVFDDSEPVQKILSNRVRYTTNLYDKPLYTQQTSLWSRGGQQSGPWARTRWKVSAAVVVLNRPLPPRSRQPIKFRGDVRLNVEEKKTRSAREGDRRDIRPRGPGGPGGPRERIGGGGGPRGGMSQKPSFGSGRGAGPGEGRYAGPRQ